MQRVRWKTATWFGVSAALVALGGCSLGHNADVELAEGAFLSQADSCDDLLGKIQADAIAKVDQQVIDALKTFDNGGSAGSPGGQDAGLDFGGSAGNGGGGGAGGFGGSAPPGVPGNGGNEGGAGRGGVPADHSDTTTQVEGVDEADIVKTDGQHIFMLHGSALLVVDAWPASNLAINDTIRIEGEPSEMFVHDGSALIYSTVYGYSESNANDYPYRDCWGGGCGYYGYGSPFTKITQIDLSASTPSVTRELYIEGSYVSSRRHDTAVRSVVQGGFKAPTLYSPQVEYVDAWGRRHERSVIETQLTAWRDRTVAGIQNTILSDWLPVEQQRVNGVLENAPQRCRDFYAPAPGATDYGLTNIVTLDLDDTDGALHGALVLGNTGTVYANADAIVLGQPQYWYDANTDLDGERTRLHRFDLDGGETRYVASGFVSGSLLNQFSLDEKDGVIRVATTARSNLNWGETRNRITTFETSGNTLTKLGQSEPLGHEGEQIYAVRYVGDIGYVVTFRNTDPLIAVDLSDNAKPTVLGELEIPGFSNFMQPFADGTHLLTIGQLDNGVQLQVFDVSNPTAPTRTHIHAYNQSGWSEANSNQKAFTFWESRGLLAFPYTDYGNYYYSPQSTLEVFRVSVDDGIVPVGSVDHTALLLENNCIQQYEDPSAPDGFYYEYYGYCPTVDVRRGLFMGDGDQGNFVYTLSYGGITVHNIDDLSAPVSSVTLPTPSYNQGDGPYLNGNGGTGGDFGGTGGVGGSGGSGGDFGGTGGVGGSGGSGGDFAQDAGSPVPVPDAGIGDGN